MTPPRVGRVVVAGSLAWLLGALIAGARWFPHASAGAVALTVWTLSGALLVLRWTLPRFRAWIDALPLGALIAVHLCRFVGIYFLDLSRAGRLPAAFAWPAGLGDVTVAVAALAMLLVPALIRSRPVVVAWNGAGLHNFVLVVVLALRCALRDWQSMAALRELPLSLLPTFIVPVIMATPVWIFVRLFPGTAGFRPTKV